MVEFYNTTLKTESEYQDTFNLIQKTKNKIENLQSNYKVHNFGDNFENKSFDPFPIQTKIIFEDPLSGNFSNINSDLKMHELNSNLKNNYLNYDLSSKNNFSTNPPSKDIIDNQLKEVNLSSNDINLNNYDSFLPTNQFNSNFYQNYDQNFDAIKKGNNLPSNFESINVISNDKVRDHFDEKLIREKRDEKAVKFILDNNNNNFNNDEPFQKIHLRNDEEMFQLQKYKELYLNMEKNKNNQLKKCNNNDVNLTLKERIQYNNKNFNLENNNSVKNDPIYERFAEIKKTFMENKLKNENINETDYINLINKQENKQNKDDLKKFESINFLINPENDLNIDAKSNKNKKYQKIGNFELNNNAENIDKKRKKKKIFDIPNNKEINDIVYSSNSVLEKFNQFEKLEKTMSKMSKNNKKEITEKKNTFSYFDKFKYFNEENLNNFKKCCLENIGTLYNDEFFEVSARTFLYEKMNKSILKIVVFYSNKKRNALNDVRMSLINSQSKIYYLLLLKKKLLFLLTKMKI